MLRVGKVLKSNGTDGGLLVSAPEVALDEIQGPVYVEFDALPVPFFIEDCTPRGTSRYIVHLTGVFSLKDAEEMVGRDILFDGEFEDSSAEPDLSEIVGWTVFDGDALLGVVEDYEPIPGNPCLYVRLSSDGRQVMIPLHQDFVIAAEASTRALRLALPEGLY